MDKQQIDRILSKQKTLAIGLVIACLGVAFIVIIALVVASVAL